MKLRLPATGFFVALAAVVSTSCGNRAPVSAVVLVTLDTTRADHLGCYGDAAASTPVLDAIAREGALFSQAQTPVPITLPSHASMFTGLHPPAHGVRYNAMFRLPEGTATVARILHEAGFATGGFPSGYPVIGDTGLAQGFSTYDDAFATTPARGGGDVERRAEDVTSAAIEWLSRVKSGRFFLWVHYYDPHFPYEPPFPYSSQFHDRPYDGEIAYVDHELGRLVQYLKSEKLWDGAVVVVAGDHGEGLWDHGEKGHGYLAYQSTLRVPLIVKPPGGARARFVKEPVSLVDVASTLLDFAGATVPTSFEGISLLPAVTGVEPPRRGLYFETFEASITYGWATIEGVRRGPFKLIRATAPELYDLETDPQEKDDVASRESGVAADLVGDLDSAIEGFKHSAPIGGAAVPEVDPTRLAKLASLGYVGGAVSRGAGGPNPRDLIYLDSDITTARQLMRAKEYKAARETWARVLAADPGNLLALLEASKAASALHLDDEAMKYAKDLVARHPDFAPGITTLGEIHASRREFDRAVDVFRSGLVRDPHDDGLRYKLALALVGAGRTDEASRVVEEALQGGAADSYRASFLLGRALCRARAGDSAGALVALREAIGKGFRDREVLEREPMLAPLRKVAGFDDAIAALPKGAG